MRVTITLPSAKVRSCPRRLWALRVTGAACPWYQLACRKSIWPVKTEWWVDGVVICRQRGADMHMAQLMPLPLTVSCFSKIQIGFTFLAPAHPGSLGKRAIKRLCVCFTLLVVVSVRQIKLTRVGFRAHVKIASRILSWRI